MPLTYRIDVLAALKKRGYNTTRLREEKLLSEGTIQRLRDGKPLSWSNLEKICSLTQLQPGSIIKYTAVPAGDEVSEPTE